MAYIISRFLINIEEIFKKYKFDNTPNKNTYHDFYTTIELNEINEIRQNYKIIDVDYLNPVLVNYEINKDKYFDSFPQQKKVVTDMLDYYLTHREKAIYKNVFK